MIVVRQLEGDAARTVLCRPLCLVVVRFRRDRYGFIRGESGKFIGSIKIPKQTL